jgi:hypothetical protein
MSKKTNITKDHFEVVFCVFRCLSRIQIFVHPGSRIPNPGSRIETQQQKRGVKKIVVLTFICSHQNHRIENYINFELVKKKIWANLQRHIELSTQKIFIKLSKICVLDPGSGISWDPGSGNFFFSRSRIEAKRHRIPDPDPQHCILLFLLSSSHCVI